MELQSGILLVKHIIAGKLDAGLDAYSGCCILTFPFSSLSQYHEGQFAQVMERIINEVRCTVVQRSVTIAIQTTKTLILKKQSAEGIVTCRKLEGGWKLVVEEH